jgi:hypothetical protein
MAGTTVYVMMCVDLKGGPVAAEVPSGVLGPINDAYFRYPFGGYRLTTTRCIAVPVGTCSFTL